MLYIKNFKIFTLFVLISPPLENWIDFVRYVVTDICTGVYISFI